MDTNFNIHEDNLQYSKKSYRAPFKVHCMALCPVNDLIAIGSKNGDIVLKRASWKQIWKTNTSQLSSLISGSSQSSLKCLEFSPIGVTIAAGMDDGHVHLIDTETGNYKHTVRLSQQSCPPSVTKLSWAKYTKEDMTSQGTKKFLNRISNNVERERKRKEPILSDGNSCNITIPANSSLYESCLSMYSQKPDVAREDVAFVFQMFYEDSEKIKFEEGIDEKLENMFITNQDFRKSYKNTILLALRDDMILTIIIAGIMPIMDINIGARLETMELMPIMVYDASYSRAMGGVTVAVTTHGKRIECKNDATAKFGVPDETKRSATQPTVNTNIICFEFQVHDAYWELALRYLRLYYGYGILRVSYEMVRKEWDTQIKILMNRFDVDSFEMGQFLWQMFNCGSSMQNGEAFLERTFGQEGLMGVREFCDKHLIEMTKIIRGQLLSAARNLEFQVAEFVHNVRLIKSDEFFEKNVEEAILGGCQVESSSAESEELQKTARGMEFKVKQLIVAAQTMIQEIGHFVKWLENLKAFSRGSRTSSLVKARRMDIDEHLKYITDNFIYDSCRWSMKMFDLPAYLDYLDENGEFRHIDEVEDLKKFKQIYDKWHKDVIKRLKTARRENAGRIFMDERRNEMPATVNKREINIDRVGSFYKDELDEVALSILGKPNNFLEGIEEDCVAECMKSIENGMERQMDKIAEVVITSAASVVFKDNVKLKMLWTYELASDANHQGYQQVKIGSLAQENLEKDDELSLEELLKRRAIHVTGCTKNTFFSKILFAPTNDDLRQIGEMREGCVDEKEFAIPSETGHIQVSGNTKENVSEEPMETDQLMELRIEIDNKPQMSEFDRLIEFENVFPANDGQVYAIGVFSTSNGEGRTTRLLKYVENDGNDRRWIVQNNVWGSTEVPEWMVTCSEMSKAAYVHDDSTRVAFFSLAEKIIQSVDEKEDAGKSYRDFQARRDRLGRLLPQFYGQMPCKKKFDNFVEKVIENGKTDEELDFGSIQF